MFKRLSFILISFWIFLMQADGVNAHYPILIGNSSPVIAKIRDVISLTYGRGHLYNPKWEEAPVPDSIKAYTFDGIIENLTDKAHKDGLTMKLDYPVYHAGDTWIVFHFPLEWSAHDMGWTETTVRTIIHLGLSKGWEEPLGIPLEIVPLTRPYGILPGDAFRVQLLHEGKPLSGAAIYAEKYFMPPLKTKHPSDVIITRTVHTDSIGTATVTLNSPGWWILFTAYEKGDLSKDDKEGPVLIQDALWVYVEKRDR